jgi:predicted NAD/FAD-binding protein
MAFFAWARAARRFEREGDWSVTLDTFLRGVPGLGEEPRERIILPWLSAMTGCSIEMARGLSARAALGPAARGLPPRLVDPYRWSTAVIGLGGVVQQLAAHCTTLRMQLDAPVIGLEHVNGAVRVHAVGCPAEDFDHVVLAAPAHTLPALLPARPELQRVLERFDYFASRVVIHDQPTYMPEERRMWSAYTALVAGGHCEASIWYGAIRDRLPDGSTVDLWKSWATARPEEPRGLLHSAEFLHPLQTPEAIRAQAEIASAQGRDRIWFAGSWTYDVDLQETALGSALRVAERLAPDSANLRRLRATQTA